jgi:predicted ATPase/transcriptional regulator with XRE-family HTH domain
MARFSLASTALTTDTRTAYPDKSDGRRRAVPRVPCGSTTQRPRVLQRGEVPADLTVQELPTLPFGTLLRSLRLAAGLSQEALAERARLSIDAISALERGTRKAPQRETLRLLADGLSLSAEDRARLEAAAAAARSPGQPRMRAETVQPASVARSAANQPRLQANAAPKHNLPHALSSFHGRERELEALGPLLLRRRLITLCGPGGVGKTRLALEAAHAVLTQSHDAFPDGVWFVDLAPLADVGLIASCVARVLGVRESTGQPLADTLVEALHGKRLMLVLDNCEHVPEASAQLAEQLLRGCTGLMLLATSREALEIDGELVFRVDPLPLPSLSALPSLADVRSSPAVRLFLDRAADADPVAFASAADDDPLTIARLCIRLDGIPLALELAAPCVRGSSLRELLAGLDARFKLLSRGRRTALPRHQTLRGMLDWSYALLAEPEQRFFRRLGIFAGSFTRDAALAVCGDGAERGESDADPMRTLLSKSLVTVVPDEDGSVRYRLLETMRLYARERLAEASEATDLAARHARFFFACAQVAAQRWRADGFGDPFGLLAPELDELHAALDWSIRDGHDVALGAALTGVAWEIWVGRGLEVEGLRRVEIARTALGPNGSLDLLAPLELALTHLKSTLFLPGVLEAADRALELHRQLYDEFGSARALFARGMALQRSERFDEAIRCHQEALERFRSLAHERMIGICLMNIGCSWQRLSEYELARDFLEQASVIFRRIGDERRCGLVMENLAGIEHALRAFEPALEDLRQALAIYRANGDEHSTVQVLTSCSETLIDLKRIEEARETACEALVSARALGIRSEVFYSFALLGKIFAVRGDRRRAARILGHIGVAIDDFDLPQLVGHVEELRGELAALLEPGEFSRLLAEGAALSEEAAAGEALATATAEDAGSRRLRTP